MQMAKSQKKEPDKDQPLKLKGSLNDILKLAVRPKKKLPDSRVINLQ